MTEYRQPLFGSDGEPCPSCGSPLASDQRYCLSCGARRGAARLPFRDILEERAASSTELMPMGAAIGGGGYGVVPASGGTINDRLRRNAPLMALVGILLVALLIGVLLGHWAGDDPPVAAASQRPQVIQVGGAAAAPAAAAPAATTPTETTAPTDTSTGTSKKRTSSSSSSSSAPKAANSDVKSLDKLSGKEYQKKIDKLGKTIKTGGKAPPKDNKAPAGGGGFEDIG